MYTFSWNFFWKNGKKNGRRVDKKSKRKLVYNTLITIYLTTSFDSEKENQIDFGIRSYTKQPEMKLYTKKLSMFIKTLIAINHKLPLIFL